MTGRVLSGRLIVLTVVELIAVFTSLDGQTESDHGYDDDIYDERYDSFSSLGKDPTFDVPAANVSVKIGETAVLPCTVTYLGKYKVAWLDNSSIPLSLEDRRVIDDARMSVVRPTVKEWNLQVQDVRRADAGPYRCTVNTKRVIAKIVWLYVVEPATIKNFSSNDDGNLEEGQDVTLTCDAEGNPPPKVTWHTTSDRVGRKHACRIHGKDGDSPDGSVLWRGPRLILKNVSRQCEGTYECRAFNGISPVATRRIDLTVLFRPEIRLANKRIGQIPGKQTILECTITASPNAVNYWQKNNSRIDSGARHQIEAYEEREHTVTLSLRITNVTHEDYGLYRCVAANALGSDSKAMELFEYIEPESYRQHTTTKVPPPAKIPKHDYYHSYLYAYRPINSFERHDSHTSTSSSSSSGFLHPIPTWARTIAESTLFVQAARCLLGPVAPLLSPRFERLFRFHS